MGLSIHECSTRSKTAKYFRCNCSIVVTHVFPTCLQKYPRWKPSFCPTNYLQFKLHFCFFLNLFTGIVKKLIMEKTFSGNCIKTNNNTRWSVKNSINCPTFTTSFIRFIYHFHSVRSHTNETRVTLFQRHFLDMVMVNIGKWIQEEKCCRLFD